MDPELFQYLCGFLTAERMDTFDRVLAQRTRFLTVGFENLYRPHNMSACVRSCDCFGVQDVHVIESRNQFEPNSQIARGATNWTTVVRYTSGQDCIRSLRENGYRIVATSPHAEHRSVRNLKISSPTAVLFGNEKEGLSPDVIDAADECVRIPMWGFTESFNISVAVAITLYEIADEVRQAGNDWALSEPEIQTLREDWVEKSLGWKLDSYLRRFEEDRAGQ
ncbi:MAG: TrmH family RNA methyltransferase [Planctomycetaceae bacterium]